MKYILLPALILTTSIAFAGANKDLSKIPVPTERKGINIEVLAENDLKTQISAFAGYDMRMRKITFAPGDTLQPHSHAIRPGLVYILEGEVVEGRNGKRKLYKAGDHWVEDAQTDHWLVNVSDKPATFIMIDLPVQK